MSRFTATAGELHQAAAWAARLTPAKPTTPALAGMVVDATEDGLTLSCFDYERSGTVRLDALVATPGKLLLPARMFADVAGAAGKNDGFTVDDSGSHVAIQAGRAKWTLPKLDLHDYPALPALGDPVGTVCAGDLRRALSRILPTVSKDPTLPMLTGVKLEATPGTLTLVGTDRFRLASADVAWEGTGEGFEILVPADLLELAVRAEADADRFEVGLGDGEGGLFSLDGGAYRLIGRQLAAEFPKWRRLIPAANTCHVTVATAELLMAVKQAEPALTNPPHMIFTVDSAASEASLAVTGDDRSANAVLTVDATSDIEIIFNVAYLKAAIEGADTDKTRFEFHPDNSQRPFLVLGDDPERYKHMVMPIRGGK